MKTQKISLSKMEGKLSREEMKNVIGGYRHSYICSCNGGLHETTVCSFTSYNGYHACQQAATNYLDNICGSAGITCTSGAQGT